ncbi:redox-sensing transcriptional repressor Rex, partial [bacterium]|nr:redox-sensing transcriptional repressor Rex [bacterium]
MDKKISEKAVSRMTLYHCILTDFIDKGIDTISSPQMASLLGVDDSQVRKDISFLNNSGKCRVGYLVKELKESIEKTLGFSKPKSAIIIGAGNLGNALANYGNFSNYGLNVIALFDTDKKKIVTSI